MPTKAGLETRDARQEKPSKDDKDSRMPTGAERRRHPRFKISLNAEITDTQFGMSIVAPVADISNRGFGIATKNPFPVETVVNVRLKKEKMCVEAQARVVFSRPGKGMGLLIVAIDPANQKNFELWLPSGHEAAWLASSRRRSQRIHMSIPVLISGWGANGSNFEEKTKTATVSVAGAMIVLETGVTKGQLLIMRNLKTEAAIECIVVYIGKPQGEGSEVGLSFAMPNSAFWHVAFPPDDWNQSHPDAKGRSR